MSTNAPDRACPVTRARYPWPRSMLLVAALTAACASPPAAPPVPSGEPALERDAMIEGRRLRYGVHLAVQPNLVYHLDCITGVALCAQATYRELWATFLPDAPAATLEAFAPAGKH